MKTTIRKRFAFFIVLGAINPAGQACARLERLADELHESVSRFCA